MELIAAEARVGCNPDAKLFRPWTSSRSVILGFGLHTLTSRISRIRVLLKNTLGILKRRTSSRICISLSSSACCENTPAASEKWASKQPSTQRLTSHPTTVQSALGDHRTSPPMARNYFRSDDVCHVTVHRIAVWMLDEMVHGAWSRFRSLVAHDVPSIIYRVSPLKGSLVTLSA